MIKSFNLQMPGEIYFGPGERKMLPGLLHRFGRKVLLISGRQWFSKSGWREKFLQLLESFELLPLQCPPGEPEVEGLNALLDKARGYQPQAIVAVGGGSVLDTAKAVSGLLSVQERVEDYLEGIGSGLELQRPGIPWIALPTTSGTGAEVTKNAVLKSRAYGAKKSLRSPYLLATAALVDPELTVGAPLSLSGIAGMDALTQLIEAFVSKKAAPVPRALARQAFPAMLQALKRIPRDPDDLDARTAAAYGSMVSGIALANSGLGAAHGFASGLGGLFDIPHGLICALFIRPVLRANAELIREDCGRLYSSAVEQEAVTGGSPADEAADPVEWLIGQIDYLFGLYDLPENLKGFAIDSAQIPEIARRSSGSSMSGNPRELSQEQREAMIAGLL
ncbi:MAG: iron-containing alcohol dehydrogenase [Spirochaetaceae bacterium]|nr:MAG: iron-containing alcohol dehydrogenase [Spirochaetaceae bacterium]